MLRKKPEPKAASAPVPKYKRCGDEQTLQQTYSRVNGSARCVQNFDDSLSFAIRMTYRISLRSSSLWEPRHPLLKVFYVTSYSLPSTVACPSEYNEFTIKMLVSHHTSRKWIIKGGRTAEADCQKFIKVHGSYLTRLPERRRAGRLRCGNDPSAGSPTETLLRLHLPLNDEV